MMTDKQIDKWVAKVNALSRDLDDEAGSIHPGVWPEMLKDKIERFKKLAGK